MIALATVCGVSLTSALGVWQLQRAQYKMAQQQQLEQQQKRPALGTDDLLHALRPSSTGISVPMKNTHILDDLWNRAVDVQGVWQSEHTVFLENRQMNGRVGFFVLTPLQINPQAPWLMVQRGWVARDFQDRSRVPSWVDGADVVRIRGRLLSAPARVYELGTAPQASAASVAEASSIRLNLDLQSFSEEIRHPLFMGMVVQTQQTEPQELESVPLLRQWSAPDSGVQKHHGYAFQWFALSVVQIMLYLWFRMIKPWRTARHQRMSTPQESGS